MQLSEFLKFPRFCGLIFWVAGVLALLAAPGHGQTLYQFGNPGAEEQLYVELINRARANPAAEGARLAATTDPDVLNAYSYFGVNLALMQSEFNAIVARPPLAPNAALTSAARGHSAWMLANATQDHNQGTVSPWTRMTSAGYYYNMAGENIFAYADSVWAGHAGFQVDWGNAPDGMQTGRGHRANIHDGRFREIGVGVVIGSNGSVGPQLVTQDFGYRSAAPAFGTGVAYYDLNGNNFYDMGEGISGVTVNVAGASQSCRTAAGGGWALPVPAAAATRAVTFSGLNVNHSVNVVFPASNNAKADLKLSYSPPAITSPALAYAGVPHQLAFAATAGATGYRWNRKNLASGAAESEVLATNSGSFTFAAGTYQLAVAPIISGRDYPASYQTLTVTNAPPPPPSPSFATWAAGFESDHLLPAGTLADPRGDFDHDGRPNLLEYAFGGSPVSGNDPASRLPAASSTATHFVLRYQRDTSLGDITLTAEACPVMQQWKTPGAAGAPAGFTDVWVSTENGIETREASIPRTSSANCFMRVKASRP